MSQCFKPMYPCVHFLVITIKPEPGGESSAIIAPIGAAGFPAFISLEALASLTGISHDLLTASIH